MTTVVVVVVDAVLLGVERLVVVVRGRLVVVVAGSVVEVVTAVVGVVAVVAVDEVVVESSCAEALGRPQTTANTTRGTASSPARSIRASVRCVLTR
ncbi:hypothetical protein [Rhabdothermincola sediminis]|uniref:hypothetical protein n=1 Tax=Rhabdothermincola sediminis TaxID=2751370 RepID=UPI001AA0166D|nr:hypothetical protein [Rhabdothermincola sediminis]